MGNSMTIAAGALRVIFRADLSICPLLLLHRHRIGIAVTCGRASERRLDWRLEEADLTS